ncbi:MAG: hypothetical protein MUF06_01880 [Pirellulaceae bacterium]|jgi:hypothetical protein|nr:hypothetical protein [Pirellulaceae bacterium]
MWSACIDRATSGRGMRYALELHARPATYRETVEAWQSDPAFCRQFSGLLAESPYDAFRWETPAVNTATLSQPFEFVILDSPELERDAEPAAFAEHFGDSAAEVVTFANLRGDATLVVPTPRAASATYVHLAAFVRGAPESQQDALWQAVGGALARRIGQQPVWLSTAGAGVAWLHVRLDDRPKYYGHAPYRQLPGGAR